MKFLKDESGKTLAYKFITTPKIITKKNIQFFINNSKKKARQSNNYRQLKF